MLSIAMRQSVWTKDLIWALAGSLFIAASAQVTIHFAVVPFTLQPQAVLLVAATLGGRRGFYAVAAYLLEGALGAPIFAGGAAGLLHLLGPRGGYLLGYLPVSFIVGRLYEFEGWRFCKLLLGNALIFCFGAPWLALYVGPVAAWKLGVYHVFSYCGRATGERGERHGDLGGRLT